MRKQHGSVDKAANLYGFLSVFVAITFDECNTYERLKQYAASLEGTLFPPTPELLAAIDDIYLYPLRETARDMLNCQLRSGIDSEQLAQLVVTLRAEDRLYLVQDEAETQETQILCSLGLVERGSDYHGG